MNHGLGTMAELLQHVDPKQASYILAQSNVNQGGSVTPYISMVEYKLGPQLLVSVQDNKQSNNQIILIY